LAKNCVISSPPLSFALHNAPTLITPPTLSGTAKVGAKLTVDPGKWEGTPAFQYRWLRCPASVTSSADVSRCEPIDGTSESTYIPAKADAGTREVAEVTARANGTAAAKTVALSAPSQVVADQLSPPKVNDPPPTPPAPQTLLKKHPRKKTSVRLAKFAFRSDQPGSRFECKFDKGAFRACRSPFKKTAKLGSHLFRVRAINRAGQADPTPASFRWKIS
jgi:hypothetical protein